MRSERPESSSTFAMKPEPSSGGVLPPYRAKVFCMLPESELTGGTSPGSPCLPVSPSRWLSRQYETIADCNNGGGNPKPVDHGGVPCGIFHRRIKISANEIAGATGRGIKLRAEQGSGVERGCVANTGPQPVRRHGVAARPVAGCNMRVVEDLKPDFEPRETPLVPRVVEIPDHSDLILRRDYKAQTAAPTIRRCPGGLRSAGNPGRA